MTQLIRRGCRYVVCGGVQCRDWENAADLAWVDLDLASTQQELTHVMTTSHPDEPEEEIVYFALNMTHFDDHEFHSLLLLLAGNAADSHHRIQDVLDSALRSQNQI